MKGLIKACSTTVGKKYAMAVTGLLLCGFLIVHLAGNLLLYVGADAYNNYAHALHSQEMLLKIAEVGLVGLFGVHIALAFDTSRQNRAARDRSYYVKESKIAGRLSPAKPETWMLISGLVVLVFLIVHLLDFTFEARETIAPITGLQYDTLEPYDKAVTLLANPLTAFVYAFGSAILGFHLAHGTASALQSLGWNHPQYEPFIRWAGVIFAAVMGVGFLSFPIIFYLKGN